MNLIQVGFVLVLLGMILLVIGAFQNSGKAKTDVAFGGFIGPLPFGFTSDPRMFWVLIALLVLSLIILNIHRYL